MNAIMNVLNYLFVPAKNISHYTREVEKQLYPLSRKLGDLFAQPNTDIVYLIQSEQQLIDIINRIFSRITQSDNKHNLKITQTYRELLTRQKGTSMLLCRDVDNIYNSSTSFKLIPIHNQPAISYLPHPTDRLIHPDDPLLNAYVTITNLLEYCNAILQKNKSPEFINQLSTNQYIVDYIIKLHAIGLNTELYTALINRNTQWLTVFFEPLTIIQNELTNLRSDEQLKEQLTIQNHQCNINKELDYLVQWSAAELHHVKKPTKEEYSHDK